MLSYHIIGNRYWNANGIGVAVAAVAGQRGDDWAAYISAQPDGASEEETTEFARRFGCKLRETEANVMFPSIAGTLVYRL